MSDPIQDIEDRQSAIDLGRTAARYFEGARIEEPDNFSHAFWATVALLLALMKSNQPKDDVGNDDNS